MTRIQFGKIVASLTVATALLVTDGAFAQSDWQSGGGEAWRKALEAGRKEGKVVVAGHPALSKPVSEAFERDTGISVEFLGGRPRELATRLTREVKSGNVTIDLTLGGGTELSLKDIGKLWLVSGDGDRVTPCRFQSHSELQWRTSIKLWHPRLRFSLV